MRKIMKAKKYIFRLCLFLLIYLIFNYFYPQLTQFFHTYKFKLNDDILIYILPFLLLLMVIFRIDEITSISKEKESFKWRVLIFACSLTVFSIPFIKFFVNSSTQGSITTYPFIIVVYYAQILFANLLLFISIFGLKFIRKLKMEIFFVFFTVILYMGAQFLIEHNWKFFSGIIFSVLKYILTLTGSPATVIAGDLSMSLNGFKIFIGPPCAGIYSMATFIFFFIFAILLVAKKKKINFNKAFLASLVGLLIIFFLNIARILTIFLVGAYWSQALAINLFHEYLSGFFLLVVFVFFLYKILPHLIDKKNNLL